jgi:pilus assembly protein CpaC
MGRLAICAAWGLGLLVAANATTGAETLQGGPSGMPFPAAAVVPPSGPPIVLQLHQGTLIRPPGPVSTVFVADSDIADVTVKTPSLIYVTAKKIGDTVVYAVDAHDRVLVSKRIVVQYDLGSLRAAFAQLLPGQFIEANTLGDDIVLSGTVTTAAAAHKAVTITAQMFGIAEVTPLERLVPEGRSLAAKTTPEAHVIDQLVVATPNQINLRVRIAEVSAAALKELGITLSKTGSLSFTTSTFTTTPGAGLPAAGENMLSAMESIGSGHSITAVLNALTEEGMATTLAEPNLTAISGEKASFGVVQTLQIPGQSTAVTTTSSSGTSSTTPSQTTTSTEPLSAGVTLDFIATILDADHINLKLRPEVSAFNFSTTTTINGTTIPEQDQTVAETTVDLASGQSFALAGLLQRDTTQSVSKVPGLGDIPGLGTLFRSTSYNSSESELVIIVTPYIVKPILTAAASPLGGFKAADDVSQVFLGSKYRQTLPAPAQGPLGPDGEGVIGPVGFRLD